MPGLRGWYIWRNVRIFPRVLLVLRADVWAHLGLRNPRSARIPGSSPRGRSNWVEMGCAPEAAGIRDERAIRPQVDTCYYWPVPLSGYMIPKLTYILWILIASLYRPFIICPINPFRHSLWPFFFMTAINREHPILSVYTAIVKIILFM